MTTSVTQSKPKPQAMYPVFHAQKSEICDKMLENT